jgi:N-acetylglutamate synthase-like GNAT family acetyltransferase
MYLVLVLANFHRVEYQIKEVVRMQALIRCATKEDLGTLREFLTRANLGSDGLTEETVEYFLLLEDEDGSIKGTLGMENLKDCGLLRSLVVSPGQAEKDIFLLITQMMTLAKEKGMRSLFLATNKSVALPFFELLGFEKVERDLLPAELYSLEHIRHVFNVDNSLFLKFSL